MRMYLPVLLVVLSNIFYHICSKSTPDSLNPFAALTVTYAVGAVVSAICFFIFYRGENLFAQYKHLHWSTFVLGVAIVGLEVGFIYMYKAGWNIGTGQLVANAALAVCLLVVGLLLYHEKISLTKVIGVVICLFGLVLINK